MSEPNRLAASPHRVRAGRGCDVRRLLHPVLIVCIALIASAAHGQVPSPLWRTPIDEPGICGISGRWLALPHQSAPVRVWAGLITVPDGGPSAGELVTRHRQHLADLTADWKQESRQLKVPEELESRVRHASQFRPQYFDVVVTQADAGSRLDWFVDYNIDGQLEHQGAVTWTAAAPADPSRLDRALRLALEISGTIATAHDAGLPTGEAPAKRAATEPRKSRPPSDKTARLQQRLSQLDHPAIRKQHLLDIVAAADDLIRQIERLDGPESLRLADPLYRKGRALGYRELPDVVAREPVKDPAKLQADFESNFSRLNSLVDVTQPKYVLLAIRRERRRGCRGMALDLLEQYRQTHSAPLWYHKKRYDLLYELDVTLAAHQAAADLWLVGKRPRRPIPVVIFWHGRKASSLDVSWGPLSPWRTKSLKLRRVSSTAHEGVVWLPRDSSFEVRASASDVTQFTTDAAFVQAGATVTLHDR